MKDRVEAFLDEKESIKDLLREWVKDKSISLNDRWDTFINSGLGDTSLFYYNSNVVNSDYALDDLPRYETMNMMNFVEYYIQNETYNESIDDLKEEVLERFIKEFQYDW